MRFLGKGNGVSATPGKDVREKNQRMGALARALRRFGKQSQRTTFRKQARIDSLPTGSKPWPAGATRMGTIMSEIILDRIRNTGHRPLPNGPCPRLLLSLMLCVLGSFPARALDPNLPPSGNFDLSHWYLTLPESGAPIIEPARMAAGYTHPDWFYTGADGAMVFWCPVIGGTTLNSSYPRSELREMIERTDKYLVVLSAVTPEYFLMMILDSGGSLGRARGLTIRW